MQKRFFSDSQELGSTLVWNPDWLHPGESLYGIAAKLGTANNLTIPDVLRQLGHDVTHHAYQTWTEFDAGRLSQLLQRPYDLVQTCLPYWCHRKRGTVDDYYFRALRTCPRCIEDGFHALAHQSRLLDRCPAHGCPLLTGCPSCHEPINPFVGKPWRCSACSRPFATFHRFEWLQRFRTAPARDAHAGWHLAAAHENLVTEHWSQFPVGYAAFVPGLAGRVWIRAEDAKLFVDDILYWKRNARKLGFWYWQEQQALMRSILKDHLDCTLRERVANRLHGAPGRCIVAVGQQLASELIWQTDAALGWPSFSWDALKNIELQLVKHLFHKPSGRFLADRPAEMVVRALVHSFVVSAIAACRNGRDRDRFIEPNLSWKLCTADAVKWTADDAYFLLETPSSFYVLPHLTELADRHCNLLGPGK